MVGDDEHVHGKHLERRCARGADDRRPLLERQRVVADGARAGVDEEPCAVDAGAGREVALVERRVAGKVLAPARPDEDRVPALQLDALGLRRAREVLRGDLELRGQRRERAVHETRDVEQHAAVDEQVGRIVGDVEMGAHPAAADAAGVRRRQRRVDAAEEPPVVADVADGVDARRPVLTAPVLDLGGEGQLAAVTERAARAGVRRVELHGIRRVDGGDRRVLVPGRAEVEEPRVLHLADELAHPSGAGRGRSRRPGGCQSRRREGGASEEIAASDGACTTLGVARGVWHGFLP